MAWDIIIILVVSDLASFILSPADPTSHLIMLAIVGGIALGAYRLGLVRGKKGTPEGRRKDE
jgi:hypothetical protein